MMMKNTRLPLLFTLYGRALLLANLAVGTVLNKLLPRLVPLSLPLFADIRDPGVGFVTVVRRAQLLLAGVLCGVALGLAKLVL